MCVKTEGYRKVYVPVKTLKVSGCASLYVLSGE